MHLLWFPCLYIYSMNIKVVTNHDFWFVIRWRGGGCGWWFRLIASTESGQRKVWEGESQSRQGRISWPIRRHPLHLLTGCGRGELLSCKATRLFTTSQSVKFTSAVFPVSECCFVCSSGTGHLFGPVRETAASAAASVTLARKRIKRGACFTPITPKKWLHTTSAW